MRKLTIALVALSLVVTACGANSDSSEQVEELEQQVALLQSQIEDLESQLKTADDGATTTTTPLETTTTPLETTTTPLETTTTYEAAASSTTTTITTPTSGGEPLPPQASVFVAGTFEGGLAEGEIGVVSVVSEGEDVEDYVPVILRNMTEESVARIEVSGIARDADGALYASGSSQGISPNVVSPGEIAFGYVYFGFDVDMTKAASIEYTVTWQSEKDQSGFFGSRDVVPTEWSFSGDYLAVVLSNPTDAKVEGPISIEAACFSDDGAFESVYSGFTDSDTIPPEGIAAGQISIWDGTCDQYLVTGSGYDD